MDPSPSAHGGFSSPPDPHALALVVQGALSPRAIRQSMPPSGNLSFLSFEQHYTYYLAIALFTPYVLGSIFAI